MVGLGLRSNSPVLWSFSHMERKLIKNDRIGWKIEKSDFREIAENLSKTKLKRFRSRDYCNHNSVKHDSNGLTRSEQWATVNPVKNNRMVIFQKGAILLPRRIADSDMT